MTGWRKIWRW